MEPMVNTLLWLITVAMAVMSLVLLSGRGSGLIAGYNTSSDKQKAKYDENKLCRIMGGGLIVLTLVLAFSLSQNFQFPHKNIEYLVIGLFSITIALMLILANTIARKT